MEEQRLKSQTSAELIAGNKDLLMETILFRLPPKPAARLQLVCKHWQSLISSPSFSRLHTRHCHPKPRPSFIIIFKNTPWQYFYSSPIFDVIHFFMFNSMYTKLLQSCNGLLLLDCRTYAHRREYRVYNPTTLQTRVLDVEAVFSIDGIYLVFDPSISLYYKIICVYRPDYSVKVYDSESEEWTSFGTPFSSDRNSLLMNPISCNNKLYWIQPTSKSFYFDLQTGKVEDVPQIKTPPPKHGETNNNYILESDGHIHCVSIYSGPSVKSLLVFELLGDNSGWFELYRFNLNPIAAALPEMNREVTVLGIVRGETELESFVLLHVARKVIRCRFCDGSFEVVVDLTTSDVYQESRLQFTHNTTYPFIESLAPV